MSLCAECKAPTCWTERTKLEKCLILSLIFTGVFALAVTSAYVASILINKKSQQEKETKTSNPDNVCKTPSCIFAAKSILENMDPTISPCEDFYDFACGKFLKNTIIPEDQDEIDLFSPVQDNIMKQIKILLEEPLRKGEPKAFQLVKKYYKTCMDTDAIEKYGLNTIRSILKKLGGWPLLEGDNWVENNFDWKELSSKFQKLGFEGHLLFQVFVSTHLKNASRRVLIITDMAASVNPSFRKRFLTQEDIRKAFYQYIMDTAVLLGADKNKSIKEIKEILDFKIKLMDLQVSRNSYTGQEEMSVKQLQDKIPNIPWVDYINKLLTPYDVTISGDEDVLIYKQEYLKGLGALLPTVSKRTLANYIMWNFVNLCTSYSNKAFIEADLKLAQVTSGIATRPARWIVCVQNFLSGREGIDSESLFIGAAALFVRKYFNNKTKQDAQKMVSNIHRSLQDTMKSIDWMDAKTQKNALDKLKAINFDTAYPDELLDDKKLEEFYGDLDLDENNYLKSYLKLNRFDLRNHYRRLRLPVDRNDWVFKGVTVTAINAFYAFLQNNIHIPAAMLQGRMFDTTRPHYLNYGAIGTIIGHEFTHGFDTLGSKHDKYGNEFNWWAPETKNLFLNKSQCFVEQYNKYLVPDLNLTVNGSITIRENIADNGGVAVSYKAYQELIKQQGADKTLPGLNYTQNQLFWIAAANNWCSKSRIERQLDLFFHDKHSPNRFRVIGFLSNNKDFSQDFRCPLESKMNPKHKCKLW